MYSVLKFGGSSVAGATEVSRVLDIVSSRVGAGPVVLVCSAVGGCTDALLARAAGAPDDGALLELHLRMVRRLFTGAERGGISNLTIVYYLLLHRCLFVLKIPIGNITLSMIIITNRDDSSIGF